MNLYSYRMHEAAYLAVAPWRTLSDMTRFWLKSPLNPISHTEFGRNLAASAELFERLTRRYGKPAFGFDATIIDEHSVPVHEEIVWKAPFCQLLHFVRDLPASLAPQPKLLIVAPMSGHYATLLRGTVETFLPHYDVYITDWADARMVSAEAGRFGLDDYIDYVIDMCHALADRDERPLHTLGVCQPAVPLIAAVARMEAENDPRVPASMVLMGGPIDTRCSPTQVNLLAKERGSAWFRENCIQTLPLPYPGAGREVYPGFMQLTGFMSMNFDRHFNAHVDMFKHLVRGDGESVEKTRDFYDEYLAVMDLTAEFYLETVDAVFVEHALPRGLLQHRGQLVKLDAIRRVALMTVEGENDDISGIGQTLAAHDLCSNLSPDLKLHYEQKDVGHYGVFNGSRFRRHVAPRIRAFHEGLAACGTMPATARPSLTIVA
jgi:poly(3-hydroxybutyrate) depolymerase